MWFSGSDDFKFNSVWSEPIIHKIGDTLEDAKTKQTYKRIGQILNYGEVPTGEGIYLFRDYRDKSNIYCGRAGNLRIRVAEHLNGRNTPLRRGEEYTVRWAKSSNSELSEALAIMFLEPERNSKREKAAVRKSRPDISLQEAERLGFYSSSTSREFCLKLLKFVYEF